MKSRHDEIDYHLNYSVCTQSYTTVYHKQSASWNLTTHKFNYLSLQSVYEQKYLH